MKGKLDPALYAEMSKPHESKEEATENIERFYNLVGEARKMCRVSDVMIIVKDSLVQDDVIKPFLGIVQYGASANALEMAAYAFKRGDAP